MVSLDDIRTEALALLRSVENGDPLNERTQALIELAVRASVTTLDMTGFERFAERALAAGASGAQIHEVLVLVSGLGVHSLMEGSRRLARLMRDRGHDAMTAPLDEQRSNLWAKHVGDDSYWDSFEREVPGFLDALLRLSPEAFEAFFHYCAVPWKTGTLSAVTKELISMAVDATPTHRYLPGMRLHLLNAIRLGAGRSAILQALEIAAGGPSHCGVR
ncbi:hypothetical protein PTE30175_04921 [Pandoraea terrae]|uniref:Carboxymuconolactone decarboxylase-like domain-containing protein n=1 Tax=Pandoraea terrae TaxID=1537710 RepID=A0A5E4Z4G7_9BURK|nr:carboxymuconolactone decarboxylase family protein [Pandoraea terrae]VVE55617.1 hypothetical protein PTE30175_04921 [Pandoraea terrae]